jgi:hypothetical protein
LEGRGAAIPGRMSDRRRGQLPEDRAGT